MSAVILRAAHYILPFLNAATMGSAAYLFAITGEPVWAFFAVQNAAVLTVNVLVILERAARAQRVSPVQRWEYVVNLKTADGAAPAHGDAQ